MFSTLASLAFAAFASGELTPAADHGGAELGVEGPVQTPIVHQKYFIGEREQFGYNPRYVPRTVSFGPDNRPYISGGWYLQTLDEAGRWVPLNVSKEVKQRYGDMQADHVSFFDPHVGFDTDGDMYLIGRTRLRHFWKIYRHGLLHSRDKGKTWHWYDTHVPVERLERLEASNQFPGPPPMVEGRGRELNLVVSYKKPDGTLTPPKRILIADVVPPVVAKGRHWLTVSHSGCGNVSATFGGKTHVVWMSIQPLSFHEDAANRLPTQKQGPYTPYAMRYRDDGGLGALAPCYAATYDHARGELSAPTIIGFTRRDNHNGPVISVDSKGYLHVIIGAHNDNFQYTRSRAPNSTTDGWTEPRMIGTPRPEAGGSSYTYSGFVCDFDDTLHLVTRWDYRLVYLRKKAGADWEPHKIMVEPFRRGYSVYYHRLTMDRTGRLFVNYSYYAAQLRPDEIEAYRKKWPEDDVKGECVGGLEVNLRAHDPAMLISDDHGDNWRLAITEDFVKGIQTKRR